MKFSEFQKKLSSVNEESVSPGLSSVTNNLDLILDIVKSINKSLILDDVLTLVLKNAVSITQSDRGYIVLQNNDGKLEYKLGLDNTGRQLPESSFQVSTSVVADVFIAGKSKFIESALNDRTEDTSQSIIKLELQTILCSPLITGDKKIGVIYVDSKSLRKIKVKEITETFEILAGQAAIAIKNAQLYNNQIKAYRALQNANEQLRKAKEEAEKSNRLKTEFLAQMSHEIRTPINIIFGFTSLLKEEFDIDQLQRHKETFDSITNAGKRIMNTVDTILEMSQIQTGNIDIAPVLLDLQNDIISDLIKEYKPFADEKNLELHYINEAPGSIIHADRYMVKQMFSKLLDNAIKYTHDGYVAVRIFSEGDKVCVDIKDTGVGISRDYLAMLYTPFSQEEMGYTRKFEGNGLGLAIAKKYIELNNARIKVQSVKKKGTKFSVCFDKTEL